MQLTGPVSNSGDLTLLIDTLCSKFGSTKPVCRTGNPHAREADLVAVIRSLDAAFRKCMAEKDECISALRVDITEMRERVETLERRQKETPQVTNLNWSNIVAGKAHKDENAVAMIATIATEFKKKEEKANNVVLAIPGSTLTEPDEDADFAKKLASKIGIAETKVKKVRRIKRRHDSSNAVLSSANTDPVLVVVELESTETKMEMLRRSRVLRQIPEFKDVYVNEDLTPSERIADRKLRQERDRKNNELTESTTINGRTFKFKTCPDGKKRFWGIRNGELKLVLSIVDKQ